MTGYGKLNLAGMVTLPAAAALAALISFGPRTDTLLTVAGINLLPVLLAGLVSALVFPWGKWPDVESWYGARGVKP